MANILVAEDDRSMRLLTSARLSDTYKVICACNGAEALDIIHRGGVDLIVADVMMPLMDGFELLKTVREEGYTTPFLMLTAAESLDAKRRGFALDTDDYMTKPFSSEELKWRIAPFTLSSRIYASAAQTRRRSASVTAVRMR